MRIFKFKDGLEVDMDEIVAIGPIETKFLMVSYPISYVNLIMKAIPYPVEIKGTYPKDEDFIKEVEEFKKEWRRDYSSQAFKPKFHPGYNGYPIESSNHGYFCIKCNTRINSPNYYPCKGCGYDGK